MSIQPSANGNGRTAFNPVRKMFNQTIKPRKKEKHPVIDAMHSIVERAGADEDLNKLAESANCSKSTYKGWFDGDTMQPQFQTVARTLNALGYEVQIVPIRKPVNGKIKAAAPEIVWRKNHLS